MNTVHLSDSISPLNTDGGSLLALCPHATSLAHFAVVDGAPVSISFSPGI